MFVLFLKGKVDLLGIDDFRLFGLLMEDGVRKGFALVENGEVVVRIQTDCHNSMPQGIGGARGLDLVDCFAELDGQVF